MRKFLLLAHILLDKENQFMPHGKEMFVWVYHYWLEDEENVHKESNNSYIPSMSLIVFGVRKE